ncbi:hypothetical protein FH608_046440 [Nonomuraea phyllanthi]|uniref:Transcriptional regulator WhiB n=1 Tax=Nonomuraea phyllanthi TaxID=2219224 RepID=A0A5C4V6G3_9ACTN|nr:WhiB family transcriptional regulator [Nonomuraea phyllanthi]KAB8186932.1 hypothetical protein FH608_046440 [Nonomuraea phyllanthi]
MSTPNWEKRAACRGEDLYLFFGHEGERQPDREAREQVATAICARCSVRTPCLLAAFERKDDSGVWGGLGEEERRSKRRSWLKRTAFERKTVGAYVPLPDDKHCPACGTTKSAIEFPKDRRQPDGLNRTCKECASEAGRKARAQRREAAEVA